MIFNNSHQKSAKPVDVFQNPSIPWAIDMDGTLIQEDVTEIAIRKSWRQPWFWPLLVWGLLLNLGNGQSGLRFLERTIPMNPLRELSFNSELEGLISSHRARGGTAVLATASHVWIGQKVVRQGQAAHLFDDVWGSCMTEDTEKNEVNMAAQAKARVLDQSLRASLSPSELEEEAPQKGFIYAGNSQDDLVVWSHPSCRGMILVNCQDHVLEQALEIPKPRLIVSKGFSKRTPSV